MAENNDTVKEVIMDLDQLAQKQELVASHKKIALAELSTMQSFFEMEQEKLNATGAEVCITEQNLRTLNEQLYYLQTNCSEKEKEHTEKIQKLIGLECKIDEVCQSISKSMEYDRNMNQTVNSYKQRVNQHLPQEVDAEHAALQGEVKILMNFKKRLDDRDTALMEIMNDQKLNKLQERANAIREATNKRDVESEILSAELAAKEELVAQLTTKMQVEENQHQARLRQLNKQFHQAQEKQNDLESKLQYLEKELDEI